MQHQESQVVDAVLDAYRQGAFPMADPRTGRIDWYSPDPRALMPLSIEAGDVPTGAETPTFHIARSLRSTLRAKRFQMTSDAAFESVMRCCAEPRPERPDSWIDERIVRVYTSLHRAGHAHSIEAWLPATDADRAAAATRRIAAAESAPTSPVLSSDGSLVLVGGVYGVSIGAAFFAESMFCRPELGWAVGQGGSSRRLPGTDASKVCLVHLVGHLRRRGYRLLDVQLRNEHTDQFGVYEVRRREYLRALRAACDVNVSWGCFDSRETGCA